MFQIKIKCLNRNDLNIQLKFIEKSLSLNKVNYHNGWNLINGLESHNVKEDYMANKSAEYGCSNNLFEEALSIYENIMNQRVFISEKLYSFINNQFDLKTGKVTSGFANYSLYDGLLGISAFAGALYKITGEEKYLETSGYFAGLSMELIDKMIF